MRMSRLFTNLHGRLADLTRSQSGAVAILFSVIALPLLMSAGLAIDYGRQIHYSNLLRQATDAAALAGMQVGVDTGSPSQAKARARQYFDAAVGASNLKVLSFSATYDASVPKLQVTATGDVQAQIVKAFGQPNLEFAVKSTAAYNATDTGKVWPVCVLVDAYDQQHTLLTAGGSVLNFTNCMVQVNTIDWDAVEARDTSSITSTNGENCFVGEIHHGNVTPAKNPSCTRFADPFAGKAMPAFVKCDFTSLTVSTSKTMTPGTYCGETTITGGNVTMAPGLYVFRDGNFTISGTASVTASAVTMLLTGSGPNFYMKDSSRMTLTPMTTGDFAGFALYLDNNSAKGVCEVFTDGAEMLKYPSMDTGEAPKGKKVKQAKQNGIVNCINAVIDSARLTASGVVYTSKASFLVGDQATVDLTGSFISGFLIGEANGRFNLTGASPSSSAIAAQMQKRSEKTAGTTKSVKLVE